MRNGFSDPEIEQAALSAMMQWPECRSKGLASLGMNHFLSAPHQKLFNSLGKMEEKGKPINLITVTHFLNEQGILESVGGAHYVTVTYTSTCHAPEVFDYYLTILYEENAKRKLIKTGNQLANGDFPDPENPVTSVIEELSTIPKFQTEKGMDLSEAVDDKISRMERGEQDEAILKTGLTKLDFHSPLWQSDMPLISGERKSGKSMLALSIALNVAKTGSGVGYYSLEDSRKKVIDRLLSAISRIPMHKQDHVKHLSQEEISRSVKGAGELKTLPIYIRDSIYELNQILVSARELKSSKNIRLVVIDYAQLVKPGLQKDRNREQEVAHISRSFRLLAMELEIPIILLSQLNMDGYTRESRSLEQDATAMWKISGDDTEPNKRWIEIPWQRNGESNVKFPVTFLGWCARVENFVEDERL